MNNIRALDIAFVKCTCQVYDKHDPNLCAPTYRERLRKLITYYDAHNYDAHKNIGKNLSEKMTIRLPHNDSILITAFPEINKWDYAFGGCVYCGKKVDYKRNQLAPTIIVGKHQGNLCRQCYGKIGSHNHLCPHYFHLKSICIDRKLEVVLPVGVSLLRAKLPKDLRRMIYKLIRIDLDDLCSC